MFFFLSFLFGLIVGSFVNVIAYRVPRGESIIQPRSHCTTCEHCLTPWELVPIVSWLFLRGRCRKCRAPVSVRYPVLELTTALLFSLTYLHASTWAARFAWDLFWLFMVILIGTDLTSMRVPNVLSYPGALIMLFASGAFGIQSWLNALWGAFLGFALLLLIHFVSRGNMGMGDAKLYFSIGAMLGPFYTLESFVLASLSGAVIGVLLRLTGRISRREYIPFVPHIVIGVVLTVFLGHPLTSWYWHQVVGL